MADNRTESQRAQERRKQRLERENGVLRDDNARRHPSWGGSRGYDLFHRMDLIQNYEEGLPVPRRNLRSIQRWIKEGIESLRMTGNKGTFNLSREHLLLLVLFKTVWPHAYNIECSVFIANNSSDSKIFTETEISRAMVDLGFTRKVTSTVAYQAFTPRNMLRRELFWSEPYPVGIHGTPRSRLIDIDEFGVHKKSCNRKYGSSMKGFYIRKPGNYDRGEFKLTVILAVEPGNPALNGQNPPALGSTENPRIWAEISEEAGTSAEAYRAFLEQKPLATYNAAVEQRTIIHDNLTSHKSPIVCEAIRLSGHRVVPRPPYRPQDGPVEKCINQITMDLAKRWSEVGKDEDTAGDFRVLLEDIIDQGVKGVDATFVSCGYL
jgi:hypothetical protein